MGDSETFGGCFITDIIYVEYQRISVDLQSQRELIEGTSVAEV